VVNIEGEPKPILLTMRPMEHWWARGPLALKGFGVGSYSTSAGHWESQTSTTKHEHTALEASSGTIQQDPTLRQNGQIYTMTTTNHDKYVCAGATTYSGPTVPYLAKTESCSQPVLGCDR